MESTLTIFNRLFLIFSFAVLFSTQATAIIGGSDATRGEYSEFARITVFNSDNTAILGFCSGTLIAPNKVLTAARCILSSSTLSYIVIPSFYSYNDTVSINDQFQVESIVTHPDFDPVTFENDIAIITLVTFNRPTITATPASIHTGGATFNESIARAVGAGADSSMAEPASGIIQEIDVPVTSNEMCNDSYQALQNETPVTETMMCTGFVENANGACLGDDLRDNGGPLLVTVDEQRVLVGVASFSINPCEENRATQVYSRLSEFTSFIAEQSPETNFVEIDEPEVEEQTTVISPITTLLIDE